MKDGSANLFKNERKESQNHPDYTGSIMINGQEHYFSAWIKEGKKGKFMSVSVGKPKEQKAFKARGDDEMPKIQDDEIPF